MRTLRPAPFGSLASQQSVPEGGSAPLRGGGLPVRRPTVRRGGGHRATSRAPMAPGRILPGHAQLRVGPRAASCDVVSVQASRSSATATRGSTAFLPRINGPERSPSRRVGWACTIPTLPDAAPGIERGGSLRSRPPAPARHRRSGGRDPTARRPTTPVSGCVHRPRGDPVHPHLRCLMVHCRTVPAAGFRGRELLLSDTGGDGFSRRSFFRADRAVHQSRGIE